ncbi:hypothetical protein ACCO45_004252 [Purpureocillium lilacinum]|uniref:Uncharacterized protein n=1 Tax=Purpureocillium lilacinum TaxID=33203 RepID=A0ACC4E4Q5_PURLI
MRLATGLAVGRSRREEGSCCLDGAGCGRVVGGEPMALGAALEDCSDIEERDEEDWARKDAFFSSEWCSASLDASSFMTSCVSAPATKWCSSRSGSASNSPPRMLSTSKPSSSSSESGISDKPPAAFFGDLFLVLLGDMLARPTTELPPSSVLSSRPSREGPFVGVFAVDGPEF